MSIVEFGDSPVRKVTDQVKLLLREQAHGATSLQDFVLPHIANNFLGTQEFSWKMINEEYSVDSVMRLLQETTANDVTVDTEAIAKMLEAGINAPASTNTAIAVLRRIRKPDSTYATRALVALPTDAQFRNDFYPPELRKAEQPLLFFHPTQRCTEHAMDDLFKQYRTEPFALPYKTVPQIVRTVQRDPHTGIVEYVIRTPEGPIKQDPNDFLLAGAQLGFSNDPVSMLVSEFLERNNIEI